MHFFFGNHLISNVADTRQRLSPGKKDRDTQKYPLWPGSGSARL